MPMKLLAQVVSGLALAAVLLPAALFFTDRLSLATMQTVMLAASVLWFLSAPWWMGRAGPMKPPTTAAAGGGPRSPLLPRFSTDSAAIHSPDLNASGSAQRAPERSGEWGSPALAPPFTH